MALTKTTYITIFETVGSVLAIVYALLIASNTDNEVLGFGLLFVSAALFSLWAVLDKRWAFLLLQFFYMGTAVFGIFRWG